MPNVIETNSLVQWRTQWVGHIGLGLPKILSKFLFTTS